MKEGSLNSSCEVAKHFCNREIDGYKIESIAVPVVYGKDIDQVSQQIQMVQPKAILSLGESPSTALSVERIAVNLKSIEIQNPDGTDRWDVELIIGDAPTAYFATIPVRETVDAILKIGIPATISCHAGTDLCNHIMYNILHYISQQNLNIMAGFIHIPMLPQQVTVGASRRLQPSMSLENIVSGVETAIRVIIGKFKSIQ